MGGVHIAMLDFQKRERERDIYIYINAVFQENTKVGVIQI